MAFIVRRNTSHVFDVFIAILGRVLFGIPFENLDNLPTTVGVSQRLMRARLHERHSVPLVANTFTRTIILGPASALRLVSLEPFLKLFRGHVDGIVEIPGFMYELSSM